MREMIWIGLILLSAWVSYRVGFTEGQRRCHQACVRLLKAVWEKKHAA